MKERSLTQKREMGEEKTNSRSGNEGAKCASKTGNERKKTN